MTVSNALLKALADRAPTQELTRGPSVKGASFDLEQVLSDSGIDIHKVKHEADGRVILEVDCLTSTAHTEGAFFTQFADGGVSYNCHHESCAGKRWRDVKDLLNLPEDFRPGIDSTRFSLVQKPFELIPRLEWRFMPRPKWLVEGVIPAESVGGLYGDPGTFKSYLALALAGSVATGETFAGRQVIAPGFAVFVAGEGMHVHNPRLEAWEQLHQPAQNIFMLAQAVQFHEEPQLLEFIAAIREVEARMGAPCRLIVIDTLNQCSVGLDESSARDMGIWFRAINRLPDETGATVLIIHHKAKAGNYRGSTVIHGSTDFLIETSIVSPLVVKLISRKQRAAAPFEDVYLQGHLRKIKGDGLEEYPVFLPSDAPHPAVVSTEKPLNPTQVVMLSILRTSGPLTYSEWRDIAVGRGINENTFKSNLKALKAKGQVLKDNDGRYRLPDPGG